MAKIEKGKSFESPELNIDLKTYTSAIDHYYKKSEESIQLKNEIPIFLDTNILLRYYSISFKQRELLRDFFANKVNRLHISGQVQKEFIKNREEVIEKYFQSALESMLSNFQANVIDKTEKYKEENSEILKDFTYLESEINKNLKGFEKISSKLKEDIEKQRIENRQLNFSDEFLDLIATFNLDYKLEKDEISFLEKEYSDLTKAVDKNKLKNDLKSRKNYAIPGIADILEKPENPFGDYFIFHEMLKCSLDKKSDILFLTYDTTKGDWLKTNKEAHVHYILRVYQISNQSIFIVDAERFFKEHLKTNFESLINNNIITNIADNEYAKDIILEYINLEKLIRQIGEFVCIEDSESLPLNKLLYHFLDRTYINDEVYRNFSNVTQVRNQLVHRSADFINGRYSEGFLIKTLEVIESLLETFRELDSDL